jgi:ketosteroid isomerase-like protein
MRPFVFFPYAYNRGLKKEIGDMRLSAVALLFVLIGGLACLGQVPGKAEVKKTDELETLSNAWMQALKDHDTKTLDSLMADDFRLVHPSQDRVTPRAEWLAAGANMDTKSFAYQHLKVDHYGKSVAVVSSIFRVDAMLNGKPFGGPKTSCIDVWEKRHGKWQVVTRYATRPEEIIIRNPPAGDQAPKPNP